MCQVYDRMHGGEWRALGLALLREQEQRQSQYHAGH
jgi:hypothetical protein